MRGGPSSFFRMMNFSGTPARSQCSRRRFWRNRSKEKWSGSVAVGEEPDEGGLGGDLDGVADLQLAPGLARRQPAPRRPSARTRFSSPVGSFVANRRATRVGLGEDLVDAAPRLRRDGEEGGAAGEDEAAVHLVAEVLLGLLGPSR